MEFEDKRNNGCRFGDLEVGDIFLHDEAIYIVYMEARRKRGLRLSSHGSFLSVPHGFDEDDAVQKIKAKLVILRNL